MLTRRLMLAALLFSLVPALPAQADPCGMVPPVYLGEGPAIVRVGYQQTYVFFKDGIETFIIRPGFEGKVEEFGMLIPFPSVPAIKKVPDNIFPHMGAAVDPPEVVIDLRVHMMLRNGRFFGNNKNANRPQEEKGLGLKEDEVRVVKQEAIGMYEVVVLEAGSSKALKKWMEDNKFIYPNGMDQIVDDYIDMGWCFVAEKTKVGKKGNVDPQPGQRAVDPSLPTGSVFDGHVQGMAFRFKVDELVVPMRLGTANEGELHNIMYLLTEDPMKIKSIPEEYVVRQLGGEELYRNVTSPLPLRVIGGTVEQIPAWQKQGLAERRNPLPHNGAARDAFAADLLAVKEDRLIHPHEEAEKMLLMIGERLMLRGPEIDTLNEGSLQADRDKVVEAALEDLKNEMTLTVIDGNFPREVLANRDLSFSEYRMPARRNKSEFYNATQHGPVPKQPGVVTFGEVSLNEPQPQKADMHPVTQSTTPSRLFAGVSALLSTLVVGWMIQVRFRRKESADKN